MRHDFFVTGTDTGVGKTLVSAALMRALGRQRIAVAGMKPVASGCAAAPGGLRNDDALLLQAEASRPWPYQTVNPYAFEPAIAPELAAREAGIEVKLDTIETAFESLQGGSDVVIVEGAGGFLVPLGAGLSFADLPSALGLEVILVVGLRLGCVNHALLTAEAVRRRGLALAGWVGNLIDPDFERLEANLDSLGQRLDAPRLGVIGYLDPPDIDLAADALTGLPGIAVMPRG
jgi:dethiobiotin synthetase